jgi:aminoglycoside 6'-N-acetyltransferase
MTPDDGVPSAGRISFRRLTRDDFPVLGRWLAEPHVHRWWFHESTPEAVERDFGPTADGEEPAEDHLVLVDGEPIGLIQCSRYADYPEDRVQLDGFYPVPPGAVCVDYLIGVPDLTGRGWGPVMIAAFVDRVWHADPEASCVVVPVASANRPSWRALERAGFTLVARGELEPDNPVDDRSHEVLRLDRPA